MALRLNRKTMTLHEANQLVVFRPCFSLSIVHFIIIILHVVVAALIFTLFCKVSPTAGSATNKRRPAKTIAP